MATTTQFDPNNFDYATDAAQVARQRALAQALTQQSMQGRQGQIFNNQAGSFFAGGNTGGTAIGQMLQGALAGYANNQAQQGSQALSDHQQAAINNALGVGNGSGGAYSPSSFAPSAGGAAAGAPTVTGQPSQNTTPAPSAPTTGPSYADGTPDYMTGGIGPMLGMPSPGGTPGGGMIPPPNQPVGQTAPQGMIPPKKTQGESQAPDSQSPQAAPATQTQPDPLSAQQSTAAQSQAPSSSGGTASPNEFLAKMTNLMRAGPVAQQLAESMMQAQFTPGQVHEIKNADGSNTMMFVNPRTGQSQVLGKGDGLKIQAVTNADGSTSLVSVDPNTGQGGVIFQGNGGMKPDQQQSLVTQVSQSVVDPNSLIAAQRQLLNAGVNPNLIPKSVQEAQALVPQQVNSQRQADVRASNTEVNSDAKDVADVQASNIKLNKALTDLQRAQQLANNGNVWFNQNSPLGYAKGALDWTTGYSHDENELDKIDGSNLFAEAAQSVPSNLRQGELTTYASSAAPNRHSMDQTSYLARNQAMQDSIQSQIAANHLYLKNKAPVTGNGTPMPSYGASGNGVPGRYQTVRSPTDVANARLGIGGQ